MWGKKRGLAALGAALILAAAMPVAADAVKLLQGLPLEESMRHLLQARYNESTARLRHFEQDLLIVQVLTFLIGALGATAAALQSLKDAWARHARRATIAVGFTISLLTMFRATFHPEEASTIRERIGALDRARKGLEEAVLQMPRDPAQQTPYLFEVLKTFDRGLTRAGTHGVPAQAAPMGTVSFSLVATAEAASAPPAAQPPDDSQTLYFAGRGSALTLDQAKSQALEDAMAKAVAAMPGTARSPAGQQAEAAALRDYLGGFRRDAETQVRYDPSNRMYEYHTVMAVPRLFAEPAFVRHYLRVSAGQAQGRGALSLAAQPMAERVKVRCADAEDGHFTFVFTARPDGAAGTRLALERIEVHEDGSTRRTKWAFQVYVHDRPVFSLAPRDYDDDQPPVTPSAADQAQVHLGPLTGRAVDLRVVGTRVRPD